tara:strand:- start:2730 stop:3200 length:471 start_codon:yes stop_codon:yes gene_type:complete
MMTQAQKHSRYGKPGDWANFVHLPLPFPLNVPDAVGKVHKWSKMWCHKKVADNFLAAYSCVLDKYGQDKISQLHIDQFGGCVMVRKMRGSKRKWSSHAWGIAADHFPLANGLRTPWAESAFAQPEYLPFIEIMYEHNFINYGIEKGYDAMHFEIKD